MDDNMLQLVGGGEITLHSHPHTVTLDQYRRMQQLEKVRNISSNYTVQSDDDYIFSTANTGISVYLPSGSSGRVITISRIQGSGSVTIVPVSGETVNLAANIIISTSFTPKRLKGVKGVGFIEV